MPLMPIVSQTVNRLSQCMQQRMLVLFVLLHKWSLTVSLKFKDLITLLCAFQLL